MTAPVIILPVVERPNFGDPAWREQRARETHALWDMLHRAPPRTRPLLVVSNERFRVVRGQVIALDSARFTRDMRRRREVFSDDVMPEGR